MVKVKVYWIDKLIKEIEVPESFDGLDIAMKLRITHRLNKITHFLVFYENEWIYGNDYDNRKRKLKQKVE